MIVDVGAYGAQVEFFRELVRRAEILQGAIRVALQEAGAACDAAHQEFHHVRVVRAVVGTLAFLHGGCERLAPRLGIGEASREIIGAETVRGAGGVGRDIRAVERQCAIEELGFFLRMRVRLLQQQVRLVGRFVLVQRFLDFLLLLRRAGREEGFLQHGSFLLEAGVARCELLVGGDARRLLRHLADALEVAVIRLGRDGRADGHGERVAHGLRRVARRARDAQKARRHRRDGVLCEREAFDGRGRRDIDADLLGRAALRIFERALLCDEHRLRLAHRVLARRRHRAHGSRSRCDKNRAECEQQCAAPCEMAGPKFHELSSFPSEKRLNHKTCGINNSAT